MNIPSGITVIERGWLNCNQILLMSNKDAVLIDSGYGRHAGDTLALVKQHLGKRKLIRLINTHCHSDHMGGNAMIAREFRCRITVPDGEARHLNPWNPQALWLRYADQHAPRFEFTDTLMRGQSFTAGGLTWHAHAAPGHDDDALMYWNEKEKVLISGDALWQNGLGVVFPTEEANPALDNAFATLDHIEKLKPRVVIPGHGAPFSDVAEAIERARGRLGAFATDPVKNARHVVKVMLVFNLLDRGSLRLDSLASYMEKIPVYRDMNDRFIHCEYSQLAERTLDDLVKAGAVKIEGAEIKPTMRA
jgi:glyoxylase-like metal-dependent hydrolase (beta-lactamase superfamily II)